MFILSKNNILDKIFIYEKFLVFYCFDTVLHNEKHEQNTRVVVSVLVTNTENATMQHGDPLRCFNNIGFSVSHLSTKHDNTNAVI